MTPGALALVLGLVPGALAADAPVPANPAPEARFDVPQEVEVDLPDTWQGASDGPVADTPWWTAFGDPALTALIERALADNGDAQAAWSRVVQADAAAWQALAPMLPQLSLEATANMSPFDSLGFQFGGLPTGQMPDPPKVYWSGQAMATASLQPDLWGRQYLAWRASRFDARAARGDREAMALALSTRVAGAYFDVVAAREQLALLEEQLEANEQVLELTELRWERGDSSGLDVLQQRQQAASVRTRLPQTRSRLAAAERQLATLVGATRPGALPEGADELPDLAALPGPGVPADLVEHRPDLRAAEARLGSADRRHLSSTRAFLPSVRISAQAGVQFIDIQEFDTQNTWGASGSVSVPLFGGGSRIAAVRQSRAAEDAAAASYEQLLAQAVGEVETALITEGERRDELAAWQEQVEAASLAYDEARRQYRSGLVPYLNVLVAQSSLHQAQLGLITARRSLIAARVQVHDALGGGWTEALSEPEWRTR